MVDVVAIGGVATPVSSYQVIGGKVAVAPVPRQPRDQRRRAHADARQRQRPRQLRRRGLRARRRDPRVRRRRRLASTSTIADTATAVTDLAITLATALPLAFRGHVRRASATDAVSLVTLQGHYEGPVSFADTSGANPKGGWQIDPRRRIELARRRLPRGPVGRGLPIRRRRRLPARRHDRPLQDRGHPRRQRRPRTRRSSSAPTSTSTATFHLVDDLVGVRATATTSCAASPRSRTSPTSDWYVEQQVDLLADVGYVDPDQPPGREGLPGQHARPVEAAGPARGRGRRHRRRPLAPARPQAAGREGRPAVRDRHAAARVQADRRPEHLQRRLQGGRRGHDDVDDAVGLRPRRRPRLRPDATRAATRRRSASRRSSRAASASAPSSSSTASSTPTAPRARSRSSTCCSAPATTSSTSRARSTRTTR